MTISDELRDSTDWEAFTAELASYVRRDLGSGANEEDVLEITNEAIRRLLDDEHRSPPVSEGLSLLDCGRIVAWRLLRNRWRHLNRAAVGLRLFGGILAPSPFRMADQAFEEEWVIARIRAAIESDSAAQLVFQASLEGKYELADLGHLQLSERTITNAKRRLRRLRRRLRRQYAIASRRDAR